MRSPVGCKYRHALRAKGFGSRVCFFRMAPSLDGERARQLANTLLGAKDGGHHHPKRTSALTSLARSPSCLGLTRRHSEEKTRDPILVKSQRVNEINESTI